MRPMLIGSLRSHDIWYTKGDKKSWRCSTCVNGEPGSPGYPCHGLNEWFWWMRNRNRPPPDFRFTEEGADATINECSCLKKKGIRLVREQIGPREVTPPPAPTGRRKPCPCGSGGKYKQCCGWADEPEDTRGERRYWPPGGGPEAEAPPSVAPPPAPAADLVKRRRHAEREEVRAATVRRVDAALDTEHKRDEAHRQVRAARKLEGYVAARRFQGEKLDAALVAWFADEAASLRRLAAELRQEARGEAAQHKRARREELRQAREAANAKRRARRAAAP